MPQTVIPHSSKNFKRLPIYLLPPHSEGSKRSTSSIQPINLIASQWNANIKNLLWGLVLDLSAIVITSLKIKLPITS